MPKYSPIAAAALPTTGKLSWGFQRSATHVHNGVDIPRPEGTPIAAAADGVVTHASSLWEPGFTGYGAHVVIRHTDGTWTLYAHLRDVSVSPGEAVAAGQLVGTVGRTEFPADDHTGLLASGPHLHFEVSPRPYPQQSAEVRLDPVAWLGDALQEGARAAGRPFLGSSGRVDRFGPRDRRTGVRRRFGTGA